MEYTIHWLICMSLMYIDNVEIEFEDIRSLRDFPERVRRSNYFSSFMQQFEKRLRDYEHNTNDIARRNYIQKISNEIQSDLTKDDNCDLPLSDILQIQFIIENAIIGGSITVI